MPYITEEEKRELEAGKPIKTAGRLNYTLTMVIKNYWVNSSRRYSEINDILGALEGAKQEFYRRVAVPYEEIKIRSNGDVYDGI